MKIQIITKNKIVCKKNKEAKQRILAELAEKIKREKKQGE